MSRPAFVVTFDDDGAHGVAVALLRPCGAEGRDGADEDGRPFMHCLAFGRRHPPRVGQPSVYELAARRRAQLSNSARPR
jgi:hypothetical protein